MILFLYMYMIVFLGSGWVIHVYDCVPG